MSILNLLAQFLHISFENEIFWVVKAIARIYTSSTRMENLKYPTHSPFEWKKSANEILQGLRRCFRHYWLLLNMPRIFFCLYKFLLWRHLQLKKWHRLKCIKSKKYFFFTLKTFKNNSFCFYEKKNFCLKKIPKWNLSFFYVWNYRRFRPKNRKSLKMIFNW